MIGESWLLPHGTGELGFSFASASPSATPDAYFDGTHPGPTWMYAP